MKSNKRLLKILSDACDGKFEIFQFFLEGQQLGVQQRTWYGKKNLLKPQPISIPLEVKSIVFNEENLSLIYKFHAYETDCKIQTLTISVYEKGEKIFEKSCPA